jgi:hypothetical protein
MGRRILPFILAGALTAAFAAPVAAGNHHNQITQVQRGGAAGLVAAVVQVQAGVQEVHILNRSLNNLLRNADINVLNNVLNNVLRDADITIVIRDIDVLTGDITVAVLSGVTQVEIGEITVSR